MLILTLIVLMGMLGFCSQTQILGPEPSDVEICDGLDNDGDTLTDESDPINGEACGEEDTSGCSVSVMRCNNGFGMICKTETFKETCASGDEDCDGRFDEGLDCGGFPPPPPPSDAGLRR